jgi:hypothetical protein
VASIGGTGFALSIAALIRKIRLRLGAFFIPISGLQDNRNLKAGATLMPFQLGPTSTPYILQYTSKLRDFLLGLLVIILNDYNGVIPAAFQIRLDISPADGLGGILRNPLSIRAPSRSLQTRHTTFNSARPTVTKGFSLPSAGPFHANLTLAQIFKNI